MRALLNVITLLAVWGIVGGIMGCQQDDCCLPLAPEELTGTWLLTEVGYSPGSGYIVEPVSPIPAETITLGADGSFDSNIQELRGMSHYVIFDDPQQNDEIVLGLFESQPPVGVVLEQATLSYNVAFESPGLRLYFRFCFEGCHLGFQGPRS